MNEFMNQFDEENKVLGFDFKIRGKECDSVSMTEQELKDFDEATKGVMPGPIGITSTGNIFKKEEDLVTSCDIITGITQSGGKNRAWNPVTFIKAMQTSRNEGVLTYTMCGDNLIYAIWDNHEVPGFKFCTPTESVISDECVPMSQPFIDASWYVDRYHAGYGCFKNMIGTPPMVRAFMNLELDVSSQHPLKTDEEHGYKDKYKGVFSFPHSAQEELKRIHDGEKWGDIHEAYRKNHTKDGRRMYTEEEIRNGVHMGRDQGIGHSISNFNATEDSEDKGLLRSPVNVEIYVINENGEEVPMNYRVVPSEEDNEPKQ